MKKNSFIEGTLIATLGVIIVKIIGVIYVIPFNAIIGETGGALYGYGYTIYQLFLSISSAGFPFAISKLTSEYNALGYKKAIQDTYNIALKLIAIISIIIFILLIAFAPQIARLIIGNNIGNNTYEDIAFVIRVVSLAILVVPFLSVTKGLLQGHKYITPYSISQVIEQIVRVIVILVGSYLCMKVFNLPLKYAVGISVSGAFFGGLAAYIYLRIKINKNNLLPKKLPKDEVIITNKEIIKKILTYSIPFILISVVYNLYTTIDMILISRTFNDIIKLDANMTESIIGVYTTWGTKLNNIILAISTGLVTSLIPNIVDSYTKKNMKDVNDKFNKAINCVLLIIVPITIFLSLLAEPVWTVFYGKSTYGPIIYKYFVYTALFSGLYNILINTLQGINKYRLVISTVLIGLIINSILDIPLIILFNKLNINPSYGAITASLIGYIISIFISLYILKRKYQFNFNQTIKLIPKYIISYILFIITILSLKLIIPTTINSRILQLVYLGIYGIITFAIYFYINYKNNNLNYVFGDSLLKKVKKLIKKV